MSQELPIDIHYNKLQDWLLSRRHCKQDWSNHVLAIREEINRAIQDMPPIESITKLLQGTYINYFHCKEIVSILKQTEGSRTLFGSYSSQRLKDWMAIIKAYEKDNIYLAEGAQLLSRYVNFELPSLKRQLTKASQALQEYNKKQDDYARNSLEIAEKYRTACKELNIEGKHLKKEVISLLDNLPLFFDEVLKDIRSLDNEMNFYSEFRSYLSSGIVKKETCSPMLRYLHNKGNTLLYEWKYGKVPENVVRDSIDYGIEDEPTAQTDEIDWGNLDVETTEGITVDTEGQIDWGIEDVGAVEASDPVNAAGDAGASTARGEEALSMLESLHCRNLLLDELHELEAFLVQRLVELKQSNSSNFMDSLVFQAAPQSILVAADDISTMLSNVRSLINKFTRPNIKELFLICSFPKHVDKMVEKLKRMVGDSEKMQAQSEVMVLRQEEKKVEMADVEPKLENLKQKTEILKKHMEEEISQKYKGRKVNIMGQINSI